MPKLSSVLAKFTKQKLVYWAKTGSDTYGKPAFADPVEIKCRWEDKQQEVMTADGRKVMSKGYILVGTRLEEGSMVFLGTLADWQAMPTYPTRPTSLQGSREVLVLKSTPDIKAQSFVYEAYL